MLMNVKGLMDVTKSVPTHMDLTSAVVRQTLLSAMTPGPASHPAQPHTSLSPDRSIPPAGHSLTPSSISPVDGP